MRRRSKTMYDRRRSRRSDVIYNRRRSLFGIMNVRDDFERGGTGTLSRYTSLKPVS